MCNINKHKSLCIWDLKFLILFLNCNYRNKYWRTDNNLFKCSISRETYFYPAFRFIRYSPPVLKRHLSVAKALWILMPLKRVISLLG